MINLTIAGVTYPFPQTGDENWGDNVTDWAIAVSSKLLQKSGGLFQLTAEVDFGTTYGVKSAYFKSRGTNPATDGILRLANAESIKWRNAANSADLALAVNSSNDLTYAGTKLVLSGLIVNADISPSAAIAYSKLALTGSIVNADISNSAAIDRAKIATAGANHVVIDDGSGNLSSEAQLATSRGGTNLSSYTIGDILYASSTSVLAKLGIGSTGQVLKVTAGVPSWATPSTASYAITTKTGAYTLTSSDDVVLADVNSVGSFTLTVPATSSNSGKVFIVKFTAYTGLDRAVTLARSGSDVFVEGSNSTTSLTLNTLGEEVEIIGDSATGIWQVLSRRIPCVRTSYTAGTNGLGTVTVTAAYWQREGNCIYLSGRITTGTPTAAEARVNFPTGCPNSTGLGALEIVGKGAISTATKLTVLCNDSQAYVTFGDENGNVGLTSQNGNAIFGGTTPFSYFAKIPITGWAG